MRFATSACIWWLRPDSDLGPLVGIKVREYQRDGLRVLALDEVQEVARVRAADEVEGTHLEARREPVHDVDGLLRSQGPFQHLAGVIDAPRGDEILGHHHFLELLEHPVLVFGLDLVQAGDLEGQLLDLVLAQVLEDLRGHVRTQRNQEDGRLLPPRQLRLLGLEHEQYLETILTAPGGRGAPLIKITTSGETSNK